MSVEPEEDNLFAWNCTVKGSVSRCRLYSYVRLTDSIIDPSKSDSPYKGGTFRFKLELPPNFPFKAPNVSYTRYISTEVRMSLPRHVACPLHISPFFFDSLLPPPPF